MSRRFFLFATGFIFSLPFIHLPGYFQGFEFPKFIYYVFFVELSFLIFIFFGKKKIQINALTFSIFLYAIVVFIADIFGRDVSASLLGVSDRYQGFLLLFTSILLYVLLGFIPKKIIDGQWMYIKKAATICITCLCIITLFQAFLLYGLSKHVPSYNGRIIATLGNPNSLAGYIVMLIPLAFSFTKEKMMYWKNTFLSSAIFVSLVFTNSRSGFVALSVLIIASLFFFIKKIKIQAIIFSVFAVLISIFLLLFAYNIPRISFWDTRESMIHKSIIAIKTKPFLGYGQSNFPLAYPNDKLFPYSMPHNIFLDIAVSSGILGLVFFLPILFIAFRFARREVKLSFLVFLVFAQFNPMSVVHIALFWFLMGVTQHELIKSTRKDNLDPEINSG